MLICLCMFVDGLRVYKTCDVIGYVCIGLELELVVTWLVWWFIVINYPLVSTMCVRIIDGGVSCTRALDIVLIYLICYYIECCCFVRLFVYDY